MASEWSLLILDKKFFIILNTSKVVVAVDRFCKLCLYIIIIKVLTVRSVPFL
jgi:hypothetical protein